MPRSYKIILLSIILLFGCRTIVSAVDTEGFLSIAEAVSEALLNSPSLREAEIKVETARTGLNSAGDDLAISGRVQYDGSDSKLIDDTLSLSGEVRIDENWSVSTNLSDEIRSIGVKYFPYNITEEIDIRKKRVSLAGEILSFENTKKNLIAETRKAYIEAVQKEQLLRLAEEDLKLAGEQQRLTESLYSAGKVSRLDLLEVRQQVEAAKIKRTVAETAWQTSMLKIALLVGKEDPDAISVSFNETKELTPGQVDIEGTVERSIAISPELKPIRETLELAEWNKKAALRYHLNGLQLGASVSKAEKTGSTSYQISMSGPLYNESLDSQVKLAEKEIEAAEERIQVLSQARKKMILEAYRLWFQAELNLKPCQDLISVAKERLKITTLRFEHGMASGFDLVQARKQLASAEETYWQTWLNYQLAREGFYQVLWGKPLLKKGGSISEE